MKLSSILFYRALGNTQLLTVCLYGHCLVIFTWPLQFISCRLATIQQPYMYDSVNTIEYDNLSKDMSIIVVLSSSSYYYFH